MSWNSPSVKPIDEYISAVIAGIVRSISAIAVGLLVLSLSGCGSGFDFQGEWKGNRKLSTLPGENPAIANTLGQVTLQIDGSRFKLKEAGLPHEGAVRYGEGKAFLKVETRLGVPLDKEPKEVQDQFLEIVLTPRSDGGIDYHDPGGDFPEPLILEKTGTG